MATPNVGTPPKPVRHLGWTALESGRSEAHKATNAVIVAAHIADRRMAEAGDQSLSLPAVFPGDEPVFEQFDYTLDVARQKLRDARSSFSAICLPYAVALYNDYLVDAVALTILTGAPPPTADRIPGLSSLHGYLYRTTDIALESTPQMVMFEVVRAMRNCVVHGNQRADEALVSARRALRELAPNAERDWHNVTKAALPMFDHGDEIKLAALDARGAIYAAHNLARELNRQLFDWLPDRVSADIAATHYRIVRPDNVPDQPRRLKLLTGFVKMNYEMATIPPEALAEANAASRGPWPSTLPDVLGALSAEAGESNGAARRLACGKLLFAAAPSVPVMPPDAL